MLLAALLLFFLTTVASLYLSNDELRIPDCGEILNSREIVLLPKKQTCDFIITNEQRLLLEVWSSENTYDICNNIKVMDEETGKEQSLCIPSKFDGTSRRYLLRIKHLDFPVQLSIDYIQLEFACPGRISKDLIDIPFNITTKNVSNCPFSIYSSGFLQLRLVSSSTDGEVSIEVRQGRHIRRLSMSTGVIPLNESTFEVPIFCGVHMLLIYGPSAIIEAVVKEPNYEQEDEQSLLRLVKCPL